jgi:hypothetical protein
MDHEGERMAYTKHGLFLEKTACLKGLTQGFYEARLGAEKRSGASQPDSQPGTKTQVAAPPCLSFHRTLWPVSESVIGAYSIRYQKPERLYARIDQFLPGSRITA